MQEHTPQRVASSSAQCGDALVSKAVATFYTHHVARAPVWLRDGDDCLKRMMADMRFVAQVGTFSQQHLMKFMRLRQSDKRSRFQLQHRDIEMIAVQTNATPVEEQQQQQHQQNHQQQQKLQPPAATSDHLDPPNLLSLLQNPDPSFTFSMSPRFDLSDNNVDASPSAPSASNSNVLAKVLLRIGCSSKAPFIVSLLALQDRDHAACHMARTIIARVHSGLCKDMLATLASFQAAHPKTIIHNGYQYKTLADHDPHSTKCINEYKKLYPLDPTWHICPATPDTLQICTAYPWAARALVFADGSAAYTADGKSPGAQVCESRALIEQRGLFGSFGCPHSFSYDYSYKYFNGKSERDYSGSACRIDDCDDGPKWARGQYCRCKCPPFVYPPLPNSVQTPDAPPFPAPSGPAI